MGKVCAVRGCKTGSVEDRKQRQIDHVRKVSQFRVPKDLQLRKIWADELGTEFKDADTVCALHFRPEDVNVNDDVTIIGGEKYIYHRERNTLKQNARPLKNIIKTPEKTNAEESKTGLKAIKSLKKCQNLKTYSLKSSQIVKENLETFFGDPDDLEHYDTEEFEGFEPVTSDEEDSSMNVVYSFDEDNSVDGFGVRNLVEILKKTHLRQNWAWGEKDDEIFFTLFDLNALAVRCYVQVHSDMKITIFLSDNQKLVNLTGITKVESFESLTKILERLEGLKLCLGTGNSLNGRSERCYKTNTADKCSFCLKEKITWENRKLSLESKCGALVKSTKLLTKKLNYCKKKLVEARNSIHELENDMANIEEKMREKMLGTLPDIQRNIVEMFLKFAVVDKNQIRYSREWVCECLTMYKQSYTLYEYMRRQGVLPLPSPNTIQIQQKLLTILSTDNSHEQLTEI